MTLPSLLLQYTRRTLFPVQNYPQVYVTSKRFLSRMSDSRPPCLYSLVSPLFIPKSLSIAASTPRSCHIQISLSLTCVLFSDTLSHSRQQQDGVMQGCHRMIALASTCVVGAKTQQRHARSSHTKATETPELHFSCHTTLGAKQSIHVTLNTVGCQNRRQSHIGNKIYFWCQIRIFFVWCQIGKQILREGQIRNSLLILH